MKAVILAAGLGTRLRARVPKPLVKVAGREVLYRNLKILSELGVKEFIIVVGKNGELIERFLREHNFNYKIVKNNHPEKGNGYSLYLAKDYVDGKFILIMGDHVYERAFIEKAIKGEGLIGDKIAKFVDINEATKVLCRNGRVEDIGKKLKRFDYIDTGFFILTPEIFKHAEEIIKEKGEAQLSEIIKRAKVKVTEVSGYFWMDIDTPEELKKANKFLVRLSVKETGDGFISRYLNRKISLKISEFLVNRITPNQATILSFTVGILSALTTFISVPLAGILYQISSILDGIDGEIARASMRTTRFGGWLDSILDRYVDFLFLLCLSIVSNLNYFGWIVACLAIFGSFMVSYTTERYKGAFFSDFYKDFKFNLPGKRDERIFITMVFCLFGLIVELFILLAIITHIRVLATVYEVTKNKRNY
ncbi:MAG TPA: CDP-alcohol phosphatidyltransferase [Archaeoglobus profundus]|nr:CDP-alcohol phosphatidyltransferase [Archaeoglobus profundus]